MEHSDEDNIISERASKGRNSREMDLDVVPRENSESGYRKILSNKSMHVLSKVLSPEEGNGLLINLGVPDATRKQNQNNHQGNVVEATYESLRYWIKQEKSGKQQEEANLYNNLLDQLSEIGREDIKAVIKKAFEMNKELEKNDFVHM